MWIMGGMAAIPDEPRSPFLANLIVIAGFVSVFSTFATDSVASWAIGAVMIVAGAIWAGIDTGSADQSSTGGQSDGSTA